VFDWINNVYVWMAKYFFGLLCFIVPNPLWANPNHNWDLNRNLNDFTDLI